MTTDTSSAKRSWPATLLVSPFTHAQGEVRLPGSKSISNRALLLAALAQGTTRLYGLLEADDTRVMLAALKTLGISVQQEADAVVIVGGAGAFPVKQAELHLGNAGTAMRPLVAALAFAGGQYQLDGVARMRERPIGDLVDALKALGAHIEYLGTPGYPPLHIAARGAANVQVGPGGSIKVKGNVSSQFLSSLLMAAPMLAPPKGLVLEVEGDLISQPYVTLTVAMMKQFGIEVASQDGRYIVPPGIYQSPGDYAIEGDASGASYFLALGAIAGGPVTVLGVGQNSLQGDLAFADLVAAMGAQIQMGPDWIRVTAPMSASGRLKAFDVDATRIPDAAMTGAVMALFADGPCRLTGIGSWRVKETDRIAAMQAELRKVGATVESGLDWIRVTPPAVFQAAHIHTYDDHRMAMCLSLAAAGGVPITIHDPSCVAKTFPDYFLALQHLAGSGAL